MSNHFYCFHRPGLVACSLQLGAVFLVAAFSFLGCSHAAKRGEQADPNTVAFAAPTELTATLANPINIDLKWKDNASREAGYLVEYSPNADNEFVTIAAVPANATSYRHPNLMPQTRFVYRVLPYFGEASNVAEVTTGRKAPQRAPNSELAGKAGPVPAPADLRYTVKSASTLAQAAPTDLKATLIPPAGVRLEWKNHAKDEDGYLLEIKTDPNDDFKVSAFLDPGASSLTTYNLPYQTKVFFRVRVFFYGKSSNPAEKTTGQDPSEQAPIPESSKAPGPGRSR